MIIFLYERLKTLMEGAFFRDVGREFHSSAHCTLNPDGIISKACVDKAYTSVVIVNFIVHGEIIWLK